MKHNYEVGQKVMVRKGYEYKSSDAENACEGQGLLIITNIRYMDIKTIVGYVVSGGYYFKKEDLVPYEEETVKSKYWYGIRTLEEMLQYEEEILESHKKQREQSIERSKKEDTALEKSIKNYDDLRNTIQTLKALEEPPVSCVPNTDTIKKGTSFIVDGKEIHENNITMEELIQFCAESGIPSYGGPTDKKYFMEYIESQLICTRRYPSDFESMKYAHNYDDFPEGTTIDWREVFVRYNRLVDIVEMLCKERWIK